jgi:adenine-specific DNA-methyltransferase
VTGGEEKGINKGYKCRIRNRWYVVPSAWIPQAFMLRQVHHYPKIVLNDAAATSTDTIHRVKLRNGVPARTVASSFLNSLTFAFSEVIGRSYGGGVLELEPNEAEKLPLPLIGTDMLNLDELDKLLRENNINAVLDITDRVLLQDGLGLNSEETTMLRSIWQKLRDRRINRKPDSALKRV